MKRLSKSEQTMLLDLCGTPPVGTVIVQVRRARRVGRRLETEWRRWLPLSSHGLIEIGPSHPSHESREVTITSAGIGAAEPAALESYERARLEVATAVEAIDWPRASRAHQIAADAARLLAGIESSRKKAST